MKRHERQKRRYYESWSVRVMERHEREGNAAHDASFSVMA